MSSSKDGAFSSPRDGHAEWPATRAQASPHSIPSALGEWEPTRAFGDEASSPQRQDVWQATRAQTMLATQFLKDENEYLSGPAHDIGRQTGAFERELFVSCDPALAMQQQFEHLHPEFIAIHDIATASSRKLLLGIAAASGRGVHKLLIRRQGYGTPLATLEFVELPTTGQGTVRLFTTEADADTAARHGLARVLMGFSRLSAVLVGELPGHAMTAAMQSLGTEIAGGPWLNRDLLLLPLTAGSQLASHGTELGRSTGVNVRTTPQVLRPADAWAFITATWARLRHESALGGATIPELASFRSDPQGSAVPGARGVPAPVATTGRAGPGADTRPGPLVLRPLPDRAVGDTPASRQLLERYVRQVSDLTGILCCCVFELDSGRTVAHAGREARADELAMRGMDLLVAVRSAGRRLDPGESCPEVAISLDTCHLVLRGVPGLPRLALHAMLDRKTGNLTLARLQVQRMDSLFDPSIPR